MQMGPHPPPESSQGFTGKCRRPRCSSCHLHPCSKSKDKTKGSSKHADLGCGELSLKLDGHSSSTNSFEQNSSLVVMADPESSTTVPEILMAMDVDLALMEVQDKVIKGMEDEVLLLEEEDVTPRRKRLKCDAGLTRRNSPSSWIPPPPLGCLKLNIDGASRGNLGLAGGGGIARTASGDYRLLFSASFGFCSALRIELLAIFNGLELLFEKCVPKAIVETDSQIDVDLVNEDLPSTHPDFHLIR
ncbi:hypothetical protein V2J09_006564 [Rumex salicifolius]